MPPRLELVPVKCPRCGALWDRREVETDKAVHEIKCRCKRLILYRIGQNGQPDVLHERSG